jgi:hypothetical protein
VCVTQLPAAESLSLLHTHKTHACIHRRVNIIYPLDSLRSHKEHKHSIRHF